MIGNLEILLLKDDKPLRFHADPDLIAPGGNAPHDISRKCLMPVVMGACPVCIKRLIDRIIDTDTPHRSDDNLVFRSGAKPGDLVVRDGARVRVGMLMEDMVARDDIDLVQSLLRSDPHVVSGAQEGGGRVVLSDVHAGQDTGHMQTFAINLPDLEDIPVQGNPHGAVILHVAGLGHEVVIHDIAFQGIDQESIPVVGEGHPEQHVFGSEPDTSLGILAQRAGRMIAEPGPGHSGEVARHGKGLQVQDIHAPGTGYPKSSEIILTALADEIADGVRIRLSRELDERVAVVADQPPAERTDPCISLAVEINAVDVLVRKAVLSGQTFDN